VEYYFGGIDALFVSGDIEEEIGDIDSK